MVGEVDIFRKDIRRLCHEEAFAVPCYHHRFGHGLKFSQKNIHVANKLRDGDYPANLRHLYCSFSENFINPSFEKAKQKLLLFQIGAEMFCKDAANFTKRADFESRDQ